MRRQLRNGIALLGIKQAGDIVAVDGGAERRGMDAAEFFPVEFAMLHALLDIGREIDGRDVIVFGDGLMCGDFMGDDAWLACVVIGDWCLVDSDGAFRVVCEMGFVGAVEEDDVAVGAMFK